MPPCRAVLVLLLLAAATQGPVVAQMTVVDPDSAAAAADCSGTVEECLGGEAVATRRELARAGYISYNAMSRGRVPCSIRGASYYNCRPGAPANPYSRGCSAITRCRG